MDLLDFLIVFGLKLLLLFGFGRHVGNQNRTMSRKGSFWDGWVVRFFLFDDFRNVHAVQATEMRKRLVPST